MGVSGEGEKKKEEESRDGLEGRIHGDDVVSRQSL